LYASVPAYAATTAPSSVNAVIYADKTFAPINPNIYGMFIEHAGGEAILNPVGMLFKFYRDYYGTIPVEVSGNSPQPKPKDPPGGEQPVVHAGSDTFPLDVAAAWTTDRKALIVAVINPTESPQALGLKIRGAGLSGKGTLRRMAPESLTATVVIGQEPGVKIEEQALDAIPTNPTFAPFSVNIYEFQVK
jgi:alpha-N-arabinofuranosidase